MNWDWLKGAGAIVGGIGSILNAKNTQKQYDKVNSLYKDERNRNIARQDANQKSIDTAANAVFNLDEKETNTYA